MKNNIYSGVRYVPKIMDEWNRNIEYEHLSIVTFQGNSYTSKMKVPSGVDIFNNAYWTCTGNYNVQLQIYINEVRQLRKEVSELRAIVEGGK